MGLKCSLLGHRFGDPTVEREREENGSEAVTTVREVVECERCGETQVLSESTEVTAIVDESDLDDDGDDEPVMGDEAAERPDDTDDGDDEHGMGSFVEAAAAYDEDEGDDDIMAPEEEGAEILTDDEDDAPGERGYGEWPAEPGENHEPWDPEQGREEPAPEPEPEPEPEFEETAAERDSRPTHLRCTECGYVTAASESPLRAGDACPECNAYLVGERNP